MRLINTRQLVLSVAARWAQRYPLRLPGTYEAQVFQALLALDLNTATVADVEALVGTDTWTTIVCDQCRRRVSCAIEVGAELDAESRTAVLCRACCTDAYTCITGEGLAP